MPKPSADNASGLLRERLLIDAYESAMARVTAENSHLSRNRLAFERSLLAVSCQPEEDRALAALNLCCAAMDRGSVWPIKALLNPNSPLPLSARDREFLLRCHLRQAPTEPRTRARQDVSDVWNDPATRWSDTAEALMTQPYPQCPPDLAAAYEQVALGFIKEGSSWMGASAKTASPMGEQTAAQRCLDLFESLRSSCEQIQLQASASPGNVKRPARSV